MACSTYSFCANQVLISTDVFVKTLCRFVDTCSVAPLVTDNDAPTWDPWSIEPCSVGLDQREGPSGSCWTWDGATGLTHPKDLSNLRKSVNSKWKRLLISCWSRFASNLVMESWSMIGTKIPTSPQPSNSCRFVCNNLKLLSIARAHTRWYPVCVPMTLKQAEVHGQGGITDHLHSMVQEEPKSCGSCYSMLQLCSAKELKLIVQNLEPCPGQILVPICVQRRHENQKLCQHSAQARSFFALSGIASRSSKVMFVVRKAGVAINANQLLFGIVKHSTFVILCPVMSEVLCTIC